jgi:RNA polymerase sigma-70 factor (ECF subfamily)
LRPCPAPKPADAPKAAEIGIPGRQRVAGSIRECPLGGKRRGFQDVRTAYLFGHGNNRKANRMPRHVTQDKTLAITPDRFDILLKTLHKRARRLSRSPDEAEDLAQDTAVKVWQSASQGARIDNLDAYAMTSLRNMARSRWRRQEAGEELTDDMATTLPDAPQRLACADLRAALSRLPASQAGLMALIAEGETSPAELARRTGVPPGTVMSRLARARATLRGDLGMASDAPTETLWSDHAR